MSKRPSTTQRHPSATDSGDGDPFLSRWARRKRIARSGADPDASPGESGAVGEPPVAPQSAQAGVPVDGSEAVELTDEDMPPLESIDENTDMSGFFSPKVTQAVKKAALRKFFHNPAFNLVDGLDDYDDDFRSFAALGDIVTSDMRGRMEREAERAREASAEKSAESSPQAAEQPRSGDMPEAEAQRAALGDEEDAQDDAEDGAKDGAQAPQLASGHTDEPGVTREPGVGERIGRAKLRPKGAAAKNS